MGSAGAGEGEQGPRSLQEGGCHAQRAGNERTAGRQRGAGQVLNGGRRCELARWRQQRGEVDAEALEARPERETSLGAAAVAVSPCTNVEGAEACASGAETKRNMVGKGRQRQRLTKCDARL
jgi:hypothetical protein